ncbi:MAG: hypothetical protein ACIAQU_01100 [Phycisphaerales bacterium JB064]
MPHQRPSIVRSYRRHALPARRGNLLVGCLAVLGVVAVLAVVGGVIVWMNWKGWTAAAMNAGMKAGVAESNLPAEQVGRINTQIDQLTAAFEAGDVTFEDLAKVAEAVEGHPILPAGVLEYVESKQASVQGLTDEERASGRLATQRLQRATIEQGLTFEDLEPILEPISQRDEDGDQVLLQNPTAPQLKLYAEEAAKKADEFGIPSEPYDVDIAEQIERLINDTLGREVVSAPPAGGGAIDHGDAGEALEADGPGEEPTEADGAVEPEEEPVETTGGG